MKTNVLFALLFLLTFPTAVRAVWAQHEVVSPADSEKHAETTLKVVQNVEGKIHITPPALPGNDKGFILVICKKRRAEDQLEFRRVTSSWKRLQELREKVKPGAGNEAFEALFKEIEDVEDVRALVAGEAFVLERETALRSYVVWDHVIIFKKGAMIMDGGLWRTYDLPAFVEALPEAPAAPAPAPESP